MKSKTQNISKYMLAALLGAVLLFNVLTAVITAVGLSVSLNWLPGAFLTVETGSMKPELNEGDLIFVWRVPFESLEAGDTVTYYDNGNYTTHKITRITGDEMVTKGLVNEIEDSATSKEAYVAKLQFVLRGAGKLYEVLTSGWMLALCTVLILALFFAKPLIQFASKKTKRLRVGIVRVTASLCAVSCLIIPQTMTLAKYSGIMSSGQPVVAAEINFESNFLSREGNIYDIVGWDGKDYKFLLKITNYSNILKGNEEGVNLDYTLTYQRVESNETEVFSTMYDIDVIEQNGTTVDSSGVSSVRLPSGRQVEYERIPSPNSSSITLGYKSQTMTIEGGSLNTQCYEVIVNALDDNQMPTLNNGDKIMFTISAASLPGHGYSDEMNATFILTYSENTDFIKSHTVEQTTGAALVKLTLKSATLVDVNEKEVVIRYDKRLVYPNTFETNLWNLIDKRMCEYDEEEGTLTFSMPSTASMTFQFNKYSARLNDVVESHMEVTSTAIEGGGYKEQILITLSSAIAAP